MNDRSVILLARLVVLLVPVLLSVTVALMPKTVIRLVPADSTHLFGYADGDSNNDEVSGKSTFELERGLRPAITCQIREGAPYRYCGMILVSAVPSAHPVPQAELHQREFDLSHFSAVGIQLEYDGPSDSVGVTLINNEELVLEGKIRTVNRQMVAYLEKSELGGFVEIPLDDFDTADWWLAEHNISRRYRDPNFSRIREVLVHSNDEALPGTHTLRVSELVFIREWVKKSILYWTVASIWVGYLFLEVVVRLLRARRQHRRALQSLKELRGHYADLQNQAFKDTLTGLYNRAGFEKLQKLIFDSKHEADYWVILLDIDLFKNINDTYGHVIGDLVLKKFAERLRSHIRQEDVLARWGGEEFVIFTLAKTQKQIEEYMKRLHRTVKSSAFKVEMDIPGVEIEVTFSAGVTQISAGESFTDALSRADQALYEAKNAGRDTIRFFGEQSLD